jgi:hypothetical protein
MAIIFPILSTFDASGVNAAQRAFKGLNGVSKTTAIAFGALSVAITKLGIASVKAAAADEKSSRILEKQLQNTLGANKALTASVEDYISRTQMRVGVQDDLLRPSFARLVRSTEDAIKAQELLNIALDIQIATGKPLESIVNALGKGYDGNVTALSKLGLGVDQNILKSGDFNKVTEVLKSTFGGFADNEATSLEGKFRIFGIALDETKETIGKALLPALTKLMDFVLKSILPVLEVFINALTGTQSVSNSFTQSQEAAYKWGNIIRSVIQTVVDYIPYLVAFGGILVATFAVAKIAAAAGAIIKIIQGIIFVYEGLILVASGATIATAFATGGVSVAAGAAGAATAVAAMAVAFVAVNAAVDKYKQNTKDLPKIEIAPDGILADTKIYQDSVLPTIDKLGKTSTQAAKGIDKIADAFDRAKEQISAFTNELTRANGILETAKEAYASFKSSVADTFNGIIDFGTAATAETGSFLENLILQAAKATDFGDRVRTLLAMGLSESAIGQVLAAGADVGTKIADEIIAGGATIVDQVNTLVSATQSVAESVGESAAAQFYQSGITAGQALVDGIRAAIAAAGFTIDANGNIINPLAGAGGSSSTASAAQGGGGGGGGGKNKKTNAGGSNFTKQGLLNKLAKIPAMAAGGIVTKPTLAMIGEAGPEAVVPLSSRNSAMGNVYNINVNAGMGTNGAQVGKEIVDAIKRFEKTSGPVFASA